MDKQVIGVNISHLVTLIIFYLLFQLIWIISISVRKHRKNIPGAKTYYSSLKLHNECRSTPQVYGSFWTTMWWLSEHEKKKSISILYSDDLDNITTS